MTEGCAIRAKRPWLGQSDWKY